MKKKQHEILEPQTQLVPVSDIKLGSSLEQLSLEQLFELLKIIVEIEDSEQEFFDKFPSEACPKTLH